MIQSYYLEEFEKAQEYEQFISYMLNHSDAFMLVYFKYKPNAKMSKSIRTVYEALRKYKIHARYDNEWPNTINLQENGPVYRLVLYRAESEVAPILSQAGGIYNWYHPLRPMDLSFFRDGYCWLAATTHERMGWLYTNNRQEVEELIALGTNLKKSELENESELFFEQY